MYCKPGLVAHATLADPVQAVGVGGKPIVYVFCDGTAWLDPRALVAQTIVQEKNFLACVTMQHRAQVDDELLLVHGEVRAVSVSAALPARIRRRHVPWMSPLTAIRVNLNRMAAA